MELPLWVYVSCEVRSIIRFLCAVERTNTEIHKQLKELQSETCISVLMVGMWIKQFAKSRTNVRNLQHGGWSSDRMLSSLYLKPASLQNLLRVVHTKVYRSTRCTHSSYKQNATRNDDVTRYVWLLFYQGIAWSQNVLS